jgi:hypothetical protein
MRKKNCAKKKHTCIITFIYITRIPVCTTIWQKEVSWKNHKKLWDTLKHFQVRGYCSWRHNANETSISCVIIHRKAWDIGLRRFVPNSGTNRFLLVPVKNLLDTRGRIRFKFEMVFEWPIFGLFSNRIFKSNRIFELNRIFYTYCNHVRIRRQTQ